MSSVLMRMQQYKVHLADSVERSSSSLQSHICHMHHQEIYSQLLVHREKNKDDFPTNQILHTRHNKYLPRQLFVSPDAQGNPRGLH